MKYLIAIIFCVPFLIQAQTTLPNMDFENWSSSASGNFDEPDGAWATVNPIRDIFSLNPVTTFPSSDAKSGPIAVKMESGSIVGSLFVAGIIATGTFDANASIGENLLLGTPFTGRPISLKGFYKYAPVNGDSADLYVALTKWNTTTNQRDTIAQKGYREYSNIATYTPFELMLEYTSAATPDSIVVIFTSSAGGEVFQGQVGSTMHVDNLSFTYASDIDESTNDNHFEIYPNPSSGNVTLNWSADLGAVKIELFDVQGRSVTNLVNSVSQIELNLKRGIYLAKLTDVNGTILANEKITIY